MVNNKEGNFYKNRWLLLIWLVSLCGALGQNILIYSTALYVGAEIAGMLSLSYAVFAVTARLFGGYLADLRSRRLVLILGNSIFCVGTLLFGFSSSIPILLLLRGLHGVGFALVNTAASVASIDVVSPSAKSRAISFFWISLALAGAVSAYIALALIGEGNFKRLFLSTAMILAAGTLMAFLCRYENVKKRKKLRIKECLKGIIEPTALPAGVLMFMVSVSLSSVNNYALLLATDRGYSLGGHFFLFAAIFMVTANSLSANVVERFGETQSLCMVSLLFATAALLVGWFDHQALYLLLAASYGVLSGLANPVLNVLAIETTPINKRGSASGTLFIFQDIGFGVGGMICGQFISLLGYGAMFTFVGGISILAFLTAKILLKKLI